MSDDPPPIARILMLTVCESVDTKYHENGRHHDRIFQELIRRGIKDDAEESGMNTFASEIRSACLNVFIPDSPVSSPAPTHVSSSLLPGNEDSRPDFPASGIDED